MARPRLSKLTRALAFLVLYAAGEEEERAVAAIWSHAPRHFLHVGIQAERVMLPEWRAIVGTRWELRGTIIEVGTGDGMKLG